VLARRFNRHSRYYCNPNPSTHPRYLEAPDSTAMNPPQAFLSRGICFPRHEPLEQDHFFCAESLAPYLTLYFVFVPRLFILEFPFNFLLNLILLFDVGMEFYFTNVVVFPAPSQWRSLDLDCGVGSRYSVLDLHCPVSLPQGRYHGSRSPHADGEVLAWPKTRSSLGLPSSSDLDRGVDRSPRA
jgi:hypothetical protein